VRGSARPYADALFAIAVERGQAADVAAELAAVNGAIPAEARVVLGRPAVRPAAAEALLSALCARVSPLVGDFLRVLAQRRRFALLPEVATALQERVDGARGLLRARLQTARPLDAAALGALRAALGRRFGAEVLLTTEIRPELIGGARVLLGDRVLDGSLDGGLTSLRRWLAARN